MVSDDGQTVRLTLYAESGAVAAVELYPIRAITLAGKLIEAALPKLKKRMMHSETICLWCRAPLTLRRGGSPKKFCSARCRHEFHRCARRWAEAAVAAGTLSVDLLKNGDPAACTLLPPVNSLAPGDEAAPESPSRVTPRAEGRFTRQQDLETLMAQAVAARRRG